MNKVVQKIQDALNVPTDTSTISKAAWDAGMHTGEVVSKSGIQQVNRAGCEGVRVTTTDVVRKA